MNLLNVSLASAVTTAVASSVVKLPSSPRNVVAHLNFAYGSGGTSADVYLQTSLDGGATWCDIANFHVTTSSTRKAVNLSSAGASTAVVTVTDGAMAANTSQDGILGPQLRAIYTSAGTYAGTTLTLDIQSDLLPAG